MSSIVGAGVAEVERGEDPDLPTESLLPLPFDRLAMHFESSGHRQPEDLLELIGELGPARDDPIVRATRGLQFHEQARVTEGPGCLAGEGVGGGRDGLG